VAARRLRAHDYLRPLATSLDGISREPGSEGA
jgi:hypothetical protein